jgi:hypothetical protein
VRFVNEDWRLHQILSPPYSAGDTQAVPVGMTFRSDVLRQGEGVDIILTRPGGFHYNDWFNPDATGTIIIAEER